MTPCATGTFSNDSKLSECFPCEEGTFQNESQQTDCMACEPGSYCQRQSRDQGASSPTPCRAGSFGSVANMRGPEDCDACPTGYFCEAGARTPKPCPEGKRGLGERLTSEKECVSCPSSETSLPGGDCVFCKEGFYRNENEMTCQPCSQLEKGINGGTNCASLTTPWSDGKGNLTHGPRSLAEVQIQPNFWRLGNQSKSLIPCKTNASGNSTCVGGNSSVFEDDFKYGYAGKGYCSEGHLGPLCQVCENPDFYFDSEEAMMCVQCPSPADRMYLPIGCVCALALLMLSGLLIKKRFSNKLVRPLAEAHRIVARVTSSRLTRRPPWHCSTTKATPVTAMGQCASCPPPLCSGPSRFEATSQPSKGRPRLKICAPTRLQVRDLDIKPRGKLLFTFFQMASQITTVYNIDLSGDSSSLYAQSTAIFSWMDGALDLDDYLFPGQCIKAGFRYRLLARAITPIVLLLAIPPARIAFVYGRLAVAKVKRPLRKGEGEKQRTPRERWKKVREDVAKTLIDALYVAVPFALAVSFLLVATVSKGIFDSFICKEYKLDDKDVRTFLVADLRIVCDGNDYPEEYNEIKYNALIFIAIWPVGVPLLYVLCLLPIRKKLRQRKQARWVQATEFLHQDYKPEFFWWEIVTLIQRLVLSGFVLLFPIELDAWRIFVGLLFAVAYLSLLQYVQPYRSTALNTL